MNLTTLKKSSGNFVDKTKREVRNFELLRGFPRMDRSLKKRKREAETEDDHQLSLEKITITMKKVLLVSSSKHDQQVCQAISDTLQDQNVTIEVTKDLLENQNVLCVVTLNPETEVKTRQIPLFEKSNFCLKIQF